MSDREELIAQLKQLVQMVEENEEIQFVMAIVDQTHDFEDAVIHVDVCGAHEAMAVLENTIFDTFPGEFCDDCDAEPTTSKGQLN